MCQPTNNLNLVSIPSFLPPLTPPSPAMATPLQNWGVLRVYFQAVIQGESQQWITRWDGDKIPFPAIRSSSGQLPVGRKVSSWKLSLISRISVWMAGSWKTEAKQKIQKSWVGKTKRRWTQPVDRKPSPCYELNCVLPKFLCWGVLPAAPQM